MATWRPENQACQASPRCRPSSTKHYQAVPSRLASEISIRFTGHCLLSLQFSLLIIISSFISRLISLSSSAPHHQPFFALEPGAPSFYSLLHFSHLFRPINNSFSLNIKQKSVKMQYSSAILIAAYAATNVFAHGVVSAVQGANGVNLPGLSVADGTPRDCASPKCGSEADTSIIRDKELGTSKATALGRTNGGGPVDASKMVSLFMDGASANTSAVVAAREIHEAALARRANLPRAANGGTKTPKGTQETAVKAATGMAAAQGLPTTQDDGTLQMTFHQVNQDGAGPLTAAIDATSGGTDPAAFKDAQMTQDVPGIGIGGLSGAATMDFPIAVQMPAGMTCSGSVGGANNVCIARMANSALAGPFGGSVAFTQSAAAKKRAIEYNLAKRRFARALKTEE